MKLSLIMLETPIIVSDEEVKEGELYVNNGKFFHADAKFDKGNNPNNSNPRVTDHNFKIIAGIPSLPLINFNGFEKQLGIVDINKLKQKVLNKYIGKLSKSGHSAEDIDRITDRDWFGLWEGFKIAQQLNENKFSLEDIKSAYFNGGDDKDGQEFDYFFNKLQQPKIFDIEVEMEINESIEPISTGNYPHKDDYYYKPKITNSQIKITKIL